MSGCAPGNNILLQRSLEDEFAAAPDLQAQVLALIVELFDFVGLDFDLNGAEVEVFIVVGHLQNPQKLMLSHISLRLAETII